MSDPIRQHYIPKSYLNNFGEKRKEGQYWVDSLLRGEKNEIFQTTTTNVCVQKNIYTLPGEEGDRFAIERFYAREVDAVYPEVYRMLVNPNITVIGEEDKRKILNTTLSLYFRTPQFLNYRIENADWVFKQITSEVNDPEQEITVELKSGEVIKFKLKDLDQVKQERRNKIKEEWLVGHFAEWQDFVKYKMECGIEIITVPEDVPLITSDNPVSIMDLNGKMNDENLFHHDNIIEVPVNRTTYFVIYPNSVEQNRRFRITRGSRDKHFSAGVNLGTERNSYLNLVGYPGDLSLHFKSQEELGAWTPENMQSFDDLKARTAMAVELMNLIKKHKTAVCPEVAQKVREIRKAGFMKGEPMFEQLILPLAKNGFLTM